MKRRKMASDEGRFSRQRMTQTMLYDYLISLGWFSVESTPLGIVLDGDSPFAKNDTAAGFGSARFQTGSGIAGNNYVYKLLSGPGFSIVLSAQVRTLVHARRAVLGWMAGDRPPERPGHRLHAQWHENVYGKHVTWRYTRLDRDGKAGG